MGFFVYVLELLFTYLQYSSDLLIPGSLLPDQSRGQVSQGRQARMEPIGKRVIPSPYQVRDKLQRESSIVNNFIRVFNWRFPDNQIKDSTFNKWRLGLKKI
jgi:hypothetical protein